MKEVNVEKIKAQLLALGFDQCVEEKLRSQLCFDTPVVLRFVKRSGEDQCLFSVQVDSEFVSYYVATLRKGVVVSADLHALDERMAKVDWVQFDASRRAMGEVAVPIDKIVAASDMLEELRKINGHALLLYKHWVDGPLESMVPGIANIRSAHEISQRFYVVEGQAAITLGEAFKFLQNKWMERKLVAGRKEKAPASGDARENNGAGGKQKVVRQKRARKK